MNKERMEHFIQVMRDVQTHDEQQGHSHFDMHTWAEKLDSLNRPTCNTVACALGWLALSPEAQASGLRIGINGEPCSPTEHGLIYGHMAGAEYLEISRYIAETLFFNRDYGGFVTLARVIQRLQYLLDIGEVKYLERIEEVDTFNIPGGHAFEIGS